MFIVKKIDTITMGIAITWLSIMVSKEGGHLSGTGEMETAVTHSKHIIWKVLFSSSVIMKPEPTPSVVGTVN